jgi:hypothetical protein
MTARWVLGLIACAGLAAAGCSSSPSPHTGSTTTSSTPASSGTTTTTSSATTTSSTAAASGCAGLTASAGQSDGAAGTITGSIILADSGSAPCSFDGYPTMVLFGTGGSTTVAVTMVDGLSVDISPQANAAPSSVTLTPSTHLEFTYQYSDVPSGSETSCPSSSTVSVTPPGQVTGTSPIALSLAPCDNGTIRVSPLYVAS